MIEQHVGYRDGDTALDGFFVCPESGGRRPAVLVAHAWAGPRDFERGRARALAELGWAGFVLDVYGLGRPGTGPEENARLMQPFLDDRALLARRLESALRTVRGLPQVDPSRIAAIGFCFGGLCVLDLARSGADVRGVVSFHGLLGAPTGVKRGPIRAKVLVLHGQDDPLVPPAQVAAFVREMDEAGADWQVHAYGGTVHAFTEPSANDPAVGAVYSAAADRRSWTAMKDFLAEVLA